MRTGSRIDSMGSGQRIILQETEHPTYNIVPLLLIIRVVELLALAPTAHIGKSV
jgi:hypothetical protein